MADFASSASIDRVILPQPIALMFRDASDLAPVTEGLLVSVHDEKMPFVRRMLRSLPSGRWTAQRLPGFSGWPSDRDRRFVVEVTDTLGRYLPARFGITVGKAPPAVRPGSPGAISPWAQWPTLNASRTGPVRPDGAPAGYQPDYLPLFPTVARAAPGPRAEIRAQLLVLGPGGETRPASWAAMTVQVGPRIVGLGIADAGGAIVTAFGYPPYPAQVPSSDPRPAITWQARVSVYFNDLGSPLPDLEDILGQLGGTSITALGKLPADPLDLQPLTLGRPLILRTAISDTENTSSLFLQTA